MVGCIVITLKPQVSDHKSLFPSSLLKKIAKYNFQTRSFSATKNLRGDPISGFVSLSFAAPSVGHIFGLASFTSLLGLGSAVTMMLVTRYGISVQDAPINLPELESIRLLLDRLHDQVVSFHNESLNIHQTMLRGNYTPHDPRSLHDAISQILTSVMGISDALTGALRGLSFIGRSNPTLEVYHLIDDLGSHRRDFLLLAEGLRDLIRDIEITNRVNFFFRHNDYSEFL